MHSRATYGRVDHVMAQAREVAPDTREMAVPEKNDAHLRSLLTLTLTVRRCIAGDPIDDSAADAGIAAEAFRHGLVDECVLLLCPVLVGGGKPALPRGVRLDLELLDHRRFDNGVVYVRHAVRHTA